MTEEQIKAKKIFAGEKKTSMKRRDDRHDYMERRMYMITLEVEGRMPIFGRLVGNPFAEKGSGSEPRIELSALGRAVENEWMAIHSHYPQIEVRAVQMMPDNMHGILFVRERLPVHLGQVISGFKAGCRKAQRALEDATAEPFPTEKGIPLSKQVVASLSPQVAASSSPQVAAPPSPQVVAPPSPQVVAPLSSQVVSPPSPQVVTPLSPQVVAPPPQSSKRPYRPLFAKGYNDLVLRSYDELPVWQNYLHDNPRRLMMKRARPEWLRPFFGLRIGSHDYNGIGNRQLLAAPRRKAVRLSRRMDECQIEAEVARYMKMAKEGTVLVSPAISPGEKRVMRAAFDADLPTIVIVENGFTPLSKPRGEQFDACAGGRLLMLSAWEHHNEKRGLTAEQCTQMNLMALELCE